MGTFPLSLKIYIYMFCKREVEMTDITSAVNEILDGDI